MKLTEKYISQLIRHLRKSGPVILLESQMKEHPASTKSYIAFKPTAWIKAWKDQIEVMKKGESEWFQEKAWDAFKNFREEQQDWLFGYLGYDLKNELEDLYSHNKELIGAPDLFFMNPGFLLEIDLHNQIKVLRGELPDELDSAQNSGFSVQPTRQFSADEYIRLVENAKLDIYEGEYYEINLSHPIEFDFEGDPLALYDAMKAAGPVPFGSYLHIDDIDICCASPERFLAKKGDHVRSQPIKGTASRQGESEQTLKLLQESEKERAENLMIVDLVRNDLSRVSIEGSVLVSGLFEIQSFETVHQMVSTVECRVSEATDSLDVLKACFPMGSMTGAPKISAMKAIEDYENYKRGIYSGAIGYIDPEGDFDFNVVIRTAIIQQSKLVYPVGGAITSDSDAQAEWEETLVKARAITNILREGN
ncbi:MAG TPA: anthranilate synthase component I family protein [Balneolaceae bacterium]|nr:anthranilate synthase component I family protein [Balneolaceae bacterium]